jgi:hypothetical protein
LDLTLRITKNLVGDIDINQREVLPPADGLERGGADFKGFTKNLPLLVKSVR